MTGSGTTRAQFRPPMLCTPARFFHRRAPAFPSAPCTVGGQSVGMQQSWEEGGWNMFPRTDVTSGWICRTLSEGGAGTAAGRKEVEMA